MNVLVHSARLVAKVSMKFFIVIGRWINKFEIIYSPSML